MEREETILENLNKKLKEAENFKPENSEMERYQEGLCTAYIEALTIVKNILKDYCRFEECDEDNCKNCNKFNLM